MGGKLSKKKSSSGGGQDGEGSASGDGAGQAAGANAGEGGADGKRKKKKRGSAGGAGFNERIGPGDFAAAGLSRSGSFEGEDDAPARKKPWSKLDDPYAVYRGSSKASGGSSGGLPSPSGHSKGSMMAGAAPVAPPGSRASPTAAAGKRIATNGGVTNGSATRAGSETPGSKASAAAAGVAAHAKRYGSSGGLDSGSTGVAGAQAYASRVAPDDEEAWRGDPREDPLLMPSDDEWESGGEGDWWDGDWDAGSADWWSGDWGDGAANDWEKTETSPSGAADGDENLIDKDDLGDYDEAFTFQETGESLQFVRGGPAKGPGKDKAAGDRKLFGKGDGGAAGGHDGKNGGGKGGKRSTKGKGKKGKSPAKGKGKKGAGKSPSWHKGKPPKGDGKGSPERAGKGGGTKSPRPEKDSGAKQPPKVRFQWKKGKKWQDYDDEFQDLLRVALARGYPSLRISIRKTDYEIDFREMMQRNLKTNTKKEIRRFELAEGEAPGSRVGDAGGPSSGAADGAHRMVTKFQWEERADKWIDFE